MATRTLLALAVSLALANVASAQGTFGNRNVGGGVQGSAGLRQSGQVAAEGAIQRDSGGFVGASSQSMVNVRGPDVTGGLGMGGLGVGGLGMGGLGMGGLGMGGMGMGGMGMGGMGMGMGGMGMNRRGMQGFGNQFGRQGMGQQQQRTINAPIRLGFAAPKVASAVAANRFQQRLKRLPQVKDAGEVTITVADGKAVLQGVVATERDRNILERLALLEPGIDAVENELEIDPTAVSASENP